MDRVIFEHPNYKELRKEHTVVDMHSHTQASHDCSAKYDLFAAKLKQLGIGAAITDHDEIKGSWYIKKKYPKLFIIPGIEVTSKEDKHLLFYFYSHKDLEQFYGKHISPHKKKHRTNLMMIRTTLSYEHLIEEAKKYNAFTVLPHPLIRVTGMLRSLIRKKDFSIIKKVDAIEVINSTQKFKANVKAMTWAHFEKKPYTGGSDAHSLKTLGNAVTITRGETVEQFIEDIRKKRNHVIGHPNNFTAEMSNIAAIMRNKLKISKLKKK
jgi:predicted metal-dependent phosphoesterase TrpH